MDPFPSYLMRFPSRASRFQEILRSFPDIDLEELEIRPNVLRSTPQALRLPLTWIGILSGRVQASLAGTSGVHDAPDVIKLLMVGADVTMMCSALLRNGINHLRLVEQGVVEWMQKHEYASAQQMSGSMSRVCNSSWYGPRRRQTSGPAS